MSLPVKIASILLQMISGEVISYSKAKSKEIDGMLAESVLKKRLQGRTKSVIYLDNIESVRNYIRNHYGVNDLEKYVEGYDKEGLTRSEAIEIASDSKLKSIRTFKGFLVNSYHPIHAQLNDKPYTVNPAIGTFTFISDYESFTIPADVTIVGVENSENFRHIEKQKEYFGQINPLFVSRYPQSHDLTNWLKQIPNPYLHFGDFDFEGIKIYLNEYRKHLVGRASFFVPDNIVQLLQSFGNSNLYNKQFNRLPDIALIEEQPIVALIKLIHQHKKMLEQEILIR